MAWLQRLVEATRKRIEAGSYDARPDRELTPIGSLRAAIDRAYPALVAEIKPASPSGRARQVDVASLARAYSAGGACGISVLTDPDHFGGHLANLEAARVGHVPLLMKDFLVDEAQLEAAAAWGASAVLGIVRLHTEGYTDLGFPELVQRAHALDLEVLAEVVTEDELDLALETEAEIIGVNQRDLDTLEVDPGRTERLLDRPTFPTPVLHLSGIETSKDVARALAAGARGVLVGTSLMEADEPAKAARALLEVTS